jgi:hypothetical protein
LKEIAGAWARYGEEVMRNTSEASRALLRSRTMSEIMQVQVAFVHDNMQSFLDQSARLTRLPIAACRQITGRIIKETTISQ